MLIRSPSGLGVSKIPQLMTVDVVTFGLGGMFKVVFPPDSANCLLAGSCACHSVHTRSIIPWCRWKAGSEGDAKKSNKSGPAVR